MQMITALPGFQHFEFAQGLLGADSAKRTGLLALNLSDLPTFLRGNAICAHVPRTQSIGMDEAGRFKTAKLKEYPPALCKALAEGFFSTFPLSTETVKASHLPPEFLQRCKHMTCTTMGQTIGADYVGKWVAGKDQNSHWELPQRVSASMCSQPKKKYIYICYTIYIYTACIYIYIMSLSKSIGWNPIHQPSRPGRRPADNTAVSLSISTCFSWRTGHSFGEYPLVI